MSRRNLMLAGAGVAALMYSDLVAAQNAAASASVAQPAVGEIVVTAQKRSERLEQVPMTITALTPQTLTSAHVTSLLQLSSLTPALRMDRTGVNTLPSIRGVNSAVTGPGVSANIALYVDGIYQPSLAAASFDLIDVTQVEVLKGPQGTLFGRNATGGAILITTAAPSFNPSGNAMVSYGSFDDIRGSFYVTGPIGDKFAASLSLYGRDSDGYKTDLVTGAHHAAVKIRDVTGKILFRPTTDLSILLKYDHRTTSDASGLAYSTYDNNSIANFRNPDGSLKYPTAIYTGDVRHTTIPAPLDNSVRSDEVVAKIQDNFPFATLTSLTSYHDVKQTAFAQNDITSLNLSYSYFPTSEKNVSQEVNLGSSKDSFSWVVGAFYFYDKSDRPYLYSGTTLTSQAVSVRTQAYAGYADLTYRIVPHLYLTGGLRYNSETQTFDSEVQSQVSHTWNSVNERAVLRYEFAQNSNIYTSYSNGFKSGLYNTLPASKTPVQPEKINAFEIGAKTAHGPLHLETSAFYYDYRNLQVTAYSFDCAGTPVVCTNVATLQNAARARIHGADAELTYTFSPRFDVRLGGAWTHARYVSFPDAVIYHPVIQKTLGGASVLSGNTSSVGSASGNSLIRAPEFTATAGANYHRDFPQGRLDLSTNVYFSTKVYFDPGNTTYQGNYATVDLRAAWTLPGDKWTFAVYANNVTNTKYWAQVTANAYGWNGIYGLPASFGASLSAKF